MAQQSTEAAVSALAAQAGKRTAPARNFAARLFGYDLFISFALGPAPRGSLSYASDLARRLRERDFTVFFSEDEAPPGEQLDSTLLKALDSSRLLVVIANRGTLAEPRWVRKEVEEFRRRHPDRPVIPISVGGALLDPTLAGPAQEWLAFQDKIWLDEAADACETGIVSAALIERLATAPNRVRSNVSWRRVVRGVIVVLAALAIALGIAAKMAMDSAERARAELRRSISLRMTGEAPAMLTGARAGGDEQAVQQVLVARALAGPTAEVDAAMLSTLKAAPQLSKVVNTGLAIGSMAFSHDGAIIVAGRRDGTLQFWNATNLQPIGTPLKGKQDGISTVALSADGTTIVSGSEDGTLQLWNANSREPIGGPLKAHKNEAPGWAELGVQSVAISPDGSRIASSGWDWTLKLWDAKTGQQDGEPLMEQEGYVYSGLAFSNDGSRIVAAGNDPTIRLWDAKTRRLVSRLDMSDVLKGNGDVVSVAFSPSSPDGSIIVAGTKEQGVWLWNAQTGQRRALEGKPPGNIATVAFSADGTRILAGTEGGTVQMWDATTRKPMGALPTGAKDSQTRIAFSADGARIASGDEDGRLRLWDAAGGRSMLTVLSAGNKHQTDAVFGTTGALMALRRDGGKVELRSAQRGQLIRVLVGDPASGDNLVALSPDGSRMVSTSKPASGSDSASLSSGAVMRLWNTETGNLIGEPVKAERHRYFNGASFRFDGLRYVSYEQQGDTPGDHASADGRLQVWDANTGKPIGKPLEGHKGGVRHAAYSPDGTRIVSAGVDGTVRLWNADTHQPLDAPVMLHANVNVVAFSPDGAQVISADDSGTVHLWNANSRNKRGTPITEQQRPALSLSFSAAQIWSLAVSPDGSRVAVSSDEGLRLWNAHSGRSIGSLPLPAREGPVFEVTFNQEGSLVGLSRTGSVILWPGPTMWAELLCSKLTRNISHKQWQEWVSPEIEYRVQCPGLLVAE